MPAVMLFAASPNGLSHCREEDTPDDILEQAIRAYVRLVGKTIEVESESEGQSDRFSDPTSGFFGLWSPPRSTASRSGTLARVSDPRLPGPAPRR